MDVFSVFDALAVSGGDTGAPMLQSPVAGAAIRAATTSDLNVPDRRTTAGAPATGAWSVVCGPWTGAGIPTNSQALPGSLVVVQVSHGANGRGPWSTGPDAGRRLDSVLADRVTDAHRSRDGDADRTCGERGLPAAGDAEDGTESGPSRSVPIDPIESARPVGLPVRARPVKRGVTRPVAISDSVLDELAAAAIGSRGCAAVPADPRAGGAA